MNSEVNGRQQYSDGPRAPREGCWSTSNGISAPAARSAARRSPAASRNSRRAVWSWTERIGRSSRPASAVLLAAPGVAARKRLGRGDLELGARALGAVHAEPVFAVGAHVVDDRQQRAALLRQRVLDARRHLGERVPLDDALLLERAQAQGERARADPGQRAFELTEAGVAIVKIAHEQQRPLAAHDLSGQTDGACLVYGHLDRYFTK